MNQEQIILNLHQIGKIYYDLASGEWIDNQKYLSGYINGKINTIQNYLNGKKEYPNLPEWIKATLPNNLQALKKIQPIPVLPNTSPELQLECLQYLNYDTSHLNDEDKNYLSQNLLEVSIGNSWLNPAIYESFAEYLLKTKCFITYINNIFYLNVHYRNTHENKFLHGTSEMTGQEILEAMLNLKSIKIYKTISDPNKASGKKQVLDIEATQEIQLKAIKIKELWQDWIWQDKQRTFEIVKEYNEIFNSYKRPQYDGSHLEFPGINQNIELTKDQKDDVYRLIQSPVLGLFAEVGFGKTWVMVASAMELQRLKLAKRIVIAVLSSTLEQTIKEIKFLYPNGKILYRLEKKNAKLSIKEQRAILYNQMLDNSWDIIVLTHEQLTDIPLSFETQKEIINNEINQYKHNLKILDENNSKIDYKTNRKLKKELNNLIAKELNELQKLYQKDHQFVYTTWEDLSVDCLMVDESQQFKNLGFFTLQTNIAGVSNQNSLRARNLFHKINLLHKNHKKVVFSTGTPISNSISEVYNLMRYLTPDLLETTGLHTFDRWVAQFGEVQEKPEVSVTGSYKIKTRFAYFKNLPELMSMIQRFASIRTNNSSTFFEKPNPIYQTEEIKLTATQQKYMEELAKRADIVIAGKIDKESDNMAKISAQARLNSVDAALVGRQETATWSKLNTLIRNVSLIHEISKPTNGVQIIFCDLVNYIYEYISNSLSAIGIKDVAIVQKAKNREELYKLARKGDVRIILASTVIAGTGVNIQTRLCALHHLDAPWRPSDVIQREGRIVRQKNTFKNVLIFRYINQSQQSRMSYDTFIWQTLENKAKFYEQIWTNKSRLPRRIEDIYCERSLSYCQVKAIASGDGLLIQQTELANQVKNLLIEQAIFNKNHFQVKYDQRIAADRIAEYNKQIAKLNDPNIHGYFQKQTFSSYKQLHALLKQSKISFMYEDIGMIHGFTIKTKLSEDENNSNNIKMRYLVQNKIMPVHSLEHLTNFCENIRNNALQRCKEQLDYFTRIQKTSVLPIFPKLESLKEVQSKLAEVEAKINQAILEEANTNLNNNRDDDNKEIENDNTANDNTANSTTVYSNEMANPVVIIESCREILNNLNNLNYLEEHNLKWLNVIKNAVFEIMPTHCVNKISQHQYVPNPTIVEKIKINTSQLEKQQTYKKDQKGQLCLF